VTRADVTPGLALAILGDAMFGVPWPRAQSEAWRVIRQAEARNLEALAPEDVAILRSAQD